MNIKQSIALLLVLLSASFSANAENVYRVYAVTWGGAPLKVGQIVTDGYISSIKFSDFANCRAFLSTIECDRPWGARTEIGRINLLTCPDGQKIDPITGQCESKPYCEEQSTIDAMSKYHDSCTAKGGKPQIYCDNNKGSFEASCDLPSELCTPDSPNFPACLDDGDGDGDKDKCDANSPDWDANEGKCCNESNNYCDEKPPKPCTIFNRDAPHCKDDNDDVDPPTPDDDLDDPDFPDFPDDDGSGDPDISEPPVNPEKDANKAINELNKDLNKQLTRINNDLNDNHKESLTALGAVKSSVDLNTQSVLDGANHVADAVNAQSDVMTKLGNKSNEYLKSINGLLKGGFDDLGDELGKVGNGIDGIGETLKGFKDALDVTPKTDGVVPLYSADALAGLRSEVETLKSDYEAELQKMKSYFNFSSGVSSGDFNAHNLELNWHGNAINKTNQVFVTMRDNAGIISAVVLFFFGMAGIKEIMRA
ncbi:TPA: hypothetical protein ACRZ4F_002998 [Vibrio harveyi]